MQNHNSLAPAIGDTEVTFVMDRSGTMASIATAVQQSFRKFAGDQREGTKFNLVEFDDEYDVRFDGATAAQVQDYTLVPRNMTRLHDAIGRTITDLKARYAVKRPRSIILVVVTDGLENDSRHFDIEQVNKLIGECESAGWEIVFLAANQNAVKVGCDLGFSLRKSMTFAANADGVHGAFDSLSSNLVAFSAGTKRGMDYTAADRSTQTSAGVDESLNTVTEEDTD